MAALSVSVSTSRACRANVFGSRRVALPRRVAVSAHKVELSHNGKTTVLDVPDGESILSVALDKGMDLPHDCKLGVCMTCPAKLLSGTIDASGSMLSDDVADKGYTLLCVAVPHTDCKVQTISEDELLDLQLVAGNA